MAAIGFPIDREIQNPSTASTNESKINVSDITSLAGGMRGKGSLMIDNILIQVATNRNHNILHYIFYHNLNALNTLQESCQQQQLQTFFRNTMHAKVQFLQSRQLSVQEWENYIFALFCPERKFKNFFVVIYIICYLQTKSVSKWA